MQIKREKENLIFIFVCRGKLIARKGKGMAKQMRRQNELCLKRDKKVHYTSVPRMLILWEMLVKTPPLGHSLLSRNSKKRFHI